MKTLSIIPLAILQSLLLIGGQVLLKLALTRILPFSMSTAFWKSVFMNWQFAFCGICYGAATALWFYMVKHFPFSLASPMTSISYIFGMVAAIVFFHETVDIYKWAGVVLVMIGCILIAR